MSDSQFRLLPPLLTAPLAAVPPPIAGQLRPPPRPPKNTDKSELHIFPSVITGIENTPKNIVFSSCVAEPEPHHLAGGGAVTRCGSGSDGSGSDNGIKHG
jgi:hypothetical protein